MTSTIQEKFSDAIQTITNMPADSLLEAIKKLDHALKHNREGAKELILQLSKDTRPKILHALARNTAIQASPEAIQTLAKSDDADVLHILASNNTPEVQSRIGAIKQNQADALNVFNITLG